MSGLALLLTMFGLIALRVPITFSLGIAGLSFFILNGIPLNSFASKLAVSVDSFPLLALPFFILAGNLMNNGGITRRLFALADALLGSVRGGLSYVCIISSMIFSALSGSALANAAGLGTIQIKAMEERGYDKEFSACLTASAAVLGPIIPPSVIMIIYGVTAGVSIKEMFLGGMLPGLVLSGMYAVMCFYYGRKLNFPKGDKFNPREAWRAFKDAFWALMTPTIILGGIFGGVFTATEAGAVACLYTFIVGLFIYRDLKIRDIGKILLDSGKNCGAILFIAATASVLGFCLTYARVPQSLAAILVEYISNKYALLLIFMVVYLFLGTIMDGGAIVITTVPIFVPLCTALGIDLVYFGVFVGILMSLGTITPPVGTAMFVICRNTGLPIERFTISMLPWFALIAVFVILLVFVPQIITWLPAVMR
ncbi:MAG: TRAP transporter large permease [Candidatus Adiutrix sp.]|jgi:tripartite ATP-independent transporter DctM subunit|nr:TRAP transporter large permease [Candidatus Adiutrix sp.]